MRNYIRVESATIFGNDGSSDQTLTFFGQFPGQAASEATTVANLLLGAGWTFANVVSNPPLNVLLSHDFITAMMIFPTQGSQPAGGQAGQALFATLISICQQLGVDPWISPKFQDVYPWNGRAKRHFRFAKGPHLK